MSGTSTDVTSAAGPVRIVDKKGFIKVQRARALALKTAAGNVRQDGFE